MIEHGLEDPQAYRTISDGDEAENTHMAEINWTVSAGSWTRATMRQH